jgi:hypothetical protein
MYFRAKSENFNTQNGTFNMLLCGGAVVALLLLCYYLCNRNTSPVKDDEDENENE